MIGSGSFLFNTLDNELAYLPFIVGFRSASPPIAVPAVSPRFFAAKTSYFISEGMLACIEVMSLA